MKRNFLKIIKISLPLPNLAIFMVHFCRKGGISNMKKFAKLILASMLVTTAVAGVGCASSSTDTKKETATDTTKKDDSKKNQQAAFAAALIAESQLTDQFEAKKGLEGGKDVSFTVPKAGKTSDDAATFLSANYWSKDLAK